MSETQAEERGMDVWVLTLPMSSAPRAIEMDDTRDFMIYAHPTPAESLQNLFATLDD